MGRRKEEYEIGATAFTRPNKPVQIDGLPAPLTG
jgi:hypothetical protein